MIQLPDSLRRVIAHLSELPSIGPRQATRLGIFLASLSPDTLSDMARSIDLISSVTRCERCFFLHANTGKLCEICANPVRSQDVVMVVEKETDLLSLERTGKFSGRYLVIGQIPKTAILDDWQKARLARFVYDMKALPSGTAKEMILAFSPTRIGDFAATTISRELAPYAQKLTRLGRGLPSGGEIEFADEETLGSSLDGRK